MLNIKFEVVLRDVFFGEDSNIYKHIMGLLLKECETITIK
jgi:hypothetical protein